MDYKIPLNYYLRLVDLDNYDEIKHGKIRINNFCLYINNEGYINRITSNLELKYLMDFMNNYENIVIKKIYYFLIIKFLLLIENKIDKEWNIFSRCFFELPKYDLILFNRTYYLNYNNKILITEKINYNICLIINNKSYNKSFIGIIDENCDINCLYDIIDEITDDYRFNDIIIKIIGGSLDNIDKLIKIYLILKEKRIAKFIIGTYLLKNKKLDRIKYNMNENKISFIKDNEIYNYFNNKIIFTNNYSRLYNIQ